MWSELAAVLLAATTAEAGVAYPDSNKAWAASLLRAAALICST